jgi:hypothetical protein
LDIGTTVIVSFFLKILLNLDNFLLSFTCKK